MGQVRDEGVTDSSADASTASEVQKSQTGQTLQGGQTAVCQLTAAWTHTHTHTYIHRDTHTHTEREREKVMSI